MPIIHNHYTTICFFQNCFYCKKTTAVEIRGILKLLQKMAPQSQMVSVYILYKFKNIKMYLRLKLQLLYQLRLKVLVYALSKGLYF